MKLLCVVILAVAASTTAGRVPTQRVVRARRDEAAVKYEEEAPAAAPAEVPKDGEEVDEKYGGVRRPIGGNYVQTQVTHTQTQVLGGRPIDSGIGPGYNAIAGGYQGIGGEHHGGGIGGAHHGGGIGGGFPGGAIGGVGGHPGGPIGGIGGYQGGAGGYQGGAGGYQGGAGGYQGGAGGFAGPGLGYQQGQGYGAANVQFANIGPNGRPALSYEAPGISIQLREKEKGQNKELEKPGAAAEVKKDGVAFES